jgi:hypothetical protein
MGCAEVLRLRAGKRIDVPNEVHLSFAYPLNPAETAVFWHKDGKWVVRTIPK